MHNQGRGTTRFWGAVVSRTNAALRHTIQLASPNPTQLPKLEYFIPGLPLLLPPLRTEVDYAGRKLLQHKLRLRRLPVPVRILVLGYPLPISTVQAPMNHLHQAVEVGGDRFILLNVPEKCLATNLRGAVQPLQRLSTRTWEAQYNYVQGEVRKRTGMIHRFPHECNLYLSFVRYVST